MNSIPFAVAPAHVAVARGLVGAHAGDPVEHPARCAASPVRASRSRSFVASALHRIADSVAPAEPCSAC